MAVTSLLLVVLTLLMKAEAEGLSCGVRTTPANEDGRGKNYYLDRHPLLCPNDGFMSMFHLRRPTGGTISYTYKCCSSPETNQCRLQMKSTPVNSGGLGNGFFLDRHHVDCGDGNFITSFKLQRSHNKIHYRYSCCILSNRNSANGRCSTSYTKLNSFGFLGDIRYLDRHTVKCPNGKALSSFQLVRRGLAIHYRYRCCEVAAYGVWQKTEEPELVEYWS